MQQIFKADKSSFCDERHISRNSPSTVELLVWQLHPGLVHQLSADDIRHPVRRPRFPISSKPLPHDNLGDTPRMPEMIKLARGLLHLGEPIPFSVFDQSGNLLLKEGFRVNLQRTLDALLEQGWHYEPTEPPAARVRRESQRNRITTEQTGTFELLDILKTRLHRAIDNFRVRHDALFLHRIAGIALAVQEACTHDTDSALANLHLDITTPYVVLHPLQAAILCEIIGKKIGVGDDARQVLVQAALTHDLALLDIQEELDRQYTPLSADQWERVQSHPEETVAVLRELGVKDPVWLNAISQHHERLDGSGYPARTAGDALAVPSRILAIADIYSAMVRHRPYRRATVSTDAMRELLLEHGGKTDQRITQMMIKELGVFPPGTLVRLASGEIGMVKERAANTAHPVVYAFIRPDGMPVSIPVRRDTSRPEHRVQGMVPFDDYKAGLGLLRRLWNQD